VISISLGCVLHSKVIDNKGELDVMGGVHPQTWCDGAWVIPMGFKEFLQLHIGKLASLGQTVHPSLDFDIDMMALVD